MKLFFAKLLATLLSVLSGYACEPATIKTLAKANFAMEHNPEWIEQLNEVVAKDHPLKETGEDECKKSSLAKKFPTLKVPYIQFCQLPTPVEKLEELSREICQQIYIKRDDLTGGGLYGGNKPRKLEYELARAKSRNATSIITFGCAGSNHAVATSEWAKQLGLKPICMLKPQANSNVVRQNLLLHQIIGTDLHYAPNNDVRKLATFAVWNDLINNGERPYIVPTGGSTPLGTLGFVNAAFELKEQIDAQLMPEPDYIYVPCGSMATTVGLLLGCKAAGLKSKIMAIAIEPQEKPEEFKNGIAKLFRATNELLCKLTEQAFPILEMKPEDLEINLNFAGTEYAVFTPECVTARNLLKKEEDITIEGTYTAKAFAALLDDIKSKKTENKTVLFWNTYCGIDFSNRLASADYKKLPKCFHAYFEEDVQELDK